MAHHFAVHVATTGEELGRYRTQSGAEASAMRLSAKELFLEVWWVNEGVRQKMVMSRFAYGRTMPNTRSTMD